MIDEKKVEEDRKRIRLAIGIFLFAVRTGRLALLVDLIIQAIRLKLDWDKGLDLAKGVYWKKVVHNAVEKYRGSHPEDFKTNISGVPGFQKWLDQNSE